MAEIADAKLRLVALAKDAKVLQKPIGQKFIAELTKNGRSRSVLFRQLKLTRTDSFGVLFSRFMSVIDHQLVDHDDEDRKPTASERAARLEQLIKAKSNNLGTLADQMKVVICIIRRLKCPEVERCPLEQCPRCKTTASWFLPKDWWEQGKTQSLI